MRIFRLSNPEEAARAYPCATEAPRPFWADGLELSREWFAENLGKYVKGFHLEEGEEVIGHIYWAPSEWALVPYHTEPGVAWLYCEWIQRAYRGRGYMRALFSAFLEHLKAEDYKGVLVRVTAYETYMHHSHFTKRSFRMIEGGNGLMYLPLTQESVEVEPLKTKVRREGTVPVEVLVIGSLSCPVGATAVLYLRKAAAEFGDRVALREVPAGRETLARYGVANGIFVNGELKFFGPVTAAQVRAAIEKALAEARAAQGAPMAIYRDFARFYAAGPYPDFSRRMAELLPGVLERFGAKPRTLLDLACGEGTFAVLMAQQGFKVVEVDASSEMLRFAREKAEEAGVEVQFIEQDMRSLALTEKFDLVTCWYDSLNYLLEYEELAKTFANVARVLNPGGLFIFDMNTIYGLAVGWQRQPAYVQQDTDELFEVHRSSYDYERNIATLRITGFFREGGLWRRVDEEHRERGYTLREIREALTRAELEELACWGNLREMSEPKPDSPRVWFVTRG